MNRRAFAWLLLFAACGAGGVSCKRLESSPFGGKDGAPPLSAPASTAASPAAAPAGKGAGTAAAPLSSPAAEEDADEADGDAVAPPSAGRHASAKAPGRRRRSRDGTSHAAEPGGQPDAPPSGDPYETDLKVTRLVVSTGISGREPVGASTSFRSADVERLYAFVELANDSRVKDEIYVTFAPVQGGPQHRVKLEIGSEPRWRTWAFTRRPKTPGSWTAVVKTSSGRVLATTSFEVKP
jgi:hypothetical protein